MQSTIFKQKSNYWRVFALCFFTAVLLFAPHCIVDAVAGGGYFHYAGDFNDQQINFYQYANAFVKNGGSFSWATDLGSGVVNSYSFYLLGSPFFWLSMVVPARLMPWAMVPLLCLKMAVAGGGGYLWARRWVRDETWSMLAGCLYAFSGFSIYNIFFNHFLDVVALFPYMLAALDDAVIDDKKGAWRGRQLWAVPAGACCCSRRGCRCCKIRVPSTRSAGTGICSTVNPSSTARFFTAPCSCPTRPISRICFRRASSSTRA